MKAIDLKSDLTCVNQQLDNILKNMNYATIEVSTNKLILQSNIIDVDSTCQAINNKFQLYETVVGTYI